jgi:hypothetical protein
MHQKTQNTHLQSFPPVACEASATTGIKKLKIHFQFSLYLAEMLQLRDHHHNVAGNSDTTFDTPHFGDFPALGTKVKTMCKDMQRELLANLVLDLPSSVVHSLPKHRQTEGWQQPNLASMKES